MAKIVLTQKQIDDDPNIFWNSLIDAIAFEQDETRPPLQQHCHLCFRYYSEIMNGGHFQFFENNGFQYGQDVLRSLHDLGLTEVASILNDALAVAAKRQWQVIETVEQFVEGSLEQSFEKQDDDFYALSPDLHQRLYDIAMRQKSEFITIVAE
jgi:hypothetical protein